MYGIDIGKSVFHVCGMDKAGKPIQRAKFSRRTIFTFFSNAARALIGVEACPGSQWLARKLSALGHTVRIIPAQFVKPYVKSNKSDAIDAEAIAEAVQSPTMRFVQVRTEAQVDMQALHRTRDLLVNTRTRLVCQMRAFLLEYGIPVRPGVGLFKSLSPEIIADACKDLSDTMRQMLHEMRADLEALERRIKHLTDEIKAIAARDDTVRRLTYTPEFGARASTETRFDRSLGTPSTRPPASLAPLVVPTKWVGAQA